MALEQFRGPLLPIEKLLPQRFHSPFMIVLLEHEHGHGGEPARESSFEMLDSRREKDWLRVGK